MRGQVCAAKGLEKPFCNVLFSGHINRAMNASLWNMNLPILLEAGSGASISPPTYIFQCDTLITNYETSMRKIGMEKSLMKKRAILYLVILYGFLAFGWIVTILNPTGYTMIWGLFSVFPIIATILTRVITKDKSPWYLKPNLRKSWKIYLFAAFLPGVAIFLGGLLYFLLFPQDLDLGAHNLIARYSQYGAPEPSTSRCRPLS